MAETLLSYMHKAGLLLFALAVVVSMEAQNDPPPLVRNPTISQTQIAFEYAGDIWIVARDGGEAHRLTNGVGRETGPHFSPNGSQVAFTGEYDGNVDVYVVPAKGGIPRRLTYHPGTDVAVDWTPDGKRVLFRSNRDSYADGNQLYTIALNGVFPEVLPLPIAEDGSYSADGSHIAYTPGFQWEPAWKRYRGGQTMKIWLADLSDSSVVPIPRQNSNDFNPMWAGSKVYFLSDRNGPVSLWSYDIPARKVTEVVKNDGLDFKSASFGGGAIVYEQFGSLSIVDLKSGKTRPVDVRIAADLAEVRPRWEKMNNTKIANAGDLAHRPARGLRSAWRDLDRSRRKGQHSQLDQHSGNRGPRACLVARRQMDRILFRRIGRVRSSYPRPERTRRSQEDRFGQPAVVLLRSGMVAR